MQNGQSIASDSFIVDFLYLWHNTLAQQILSAGQKENHNTKYVRFFEPERGMCANLICENPYYLNTYIYELIYVCIGILYSY